MKKTGKKVPMVHLGLRIPQTLHKALVERATRERRSLNDQVLFMLESDLMDERTVVGLKEIKDFLAHLKKTEQTTAKSLSTE